MIPRIRFFPTRVLALAGAFGLVAAAGPLQAQRVCRVTEVTVQPADAQIRAGTANTFIATAYDASGSPCASLQTFHWSSSNARVLLVDELGNAIGVAPGSATITATIGTGTRRKSATATVTVIPAAAPAVQQGEPPVPGGAARPVVTMPPSTVCSHQPANGTGPAESIWVEPLTVRLVRGGEARQLNYKGQRGDGGDAQCVPLLFLVDAASSRIAAVDSVGLIISGNDTGRVAVRVQVAGNPRLQRQVNVEVAADSLRFVRSEISLAPGSSDSLTVEVPAQDHRRLQNLPTMFQFTSSDTTKVRVTPRGIIDAVAPGTARITAENPVYRLMQTVNVHAPVAFLVQTPPDSVITLAIRQPVTLTAEPRAQDSTPVPLAPVTWTPPDTTIVRFNPTTHALEGRRAGETRVLVHAPFRRDSSITRGWRIRVVAGGLALTHTRLGIGAGERAPIGVSLLDDRRQPIPGATAPITWTSSGDSVARVQDGREIVGERVGHATITAHAPWDSTASLEVYVVGDRIVSANRGGTYDLFVMSGGAIAAQLTHDSLIEASPAWSPDLTRIAYLAASPTRPGGFGLYVANADGSDARRITPDSAAAGSPAFSRPAGDKIVFDGTRAAGGRPQIWVASLDGSDARAITPPDVSSTQPDVSPDGHRVVFVSLRQTSPGLSNYDIYQTNLDGTGEERITTSARPDRSPSYSSDGRKIYFLRDEGAGTQRLYEYDVATRVEAPITAVGTFVREYSFSPDGSIISLTTSEQTREGTEIKHLMLLTRATGQMVPMPGADTEHIVSATFRPAAPPR